MQNKFLWQCFRKWILDDQSLSGGTLFGSFLLEIKFIEQKLTHNKMTGVKLWPLANPEMI